MNIVAIMTNAKKRVEKLLDEVNRMLPLLRTVGLSVKDIDVKIGLLPSVSVIVVGSLRVLDPVKIRYLRESHKDNRALNGVLRAVETAVNLKSMLGDLMVDGIEVEATLGLLPSVDVRFVPGEAVAPVKHGGAPEVVAPPSTSSPTPA